MPASFIDIDSLSRPLDDSQPSGPALDEDLDFLELERIGAGTPERQYGDKIYPAEPPDWPAVKAKALELAARSRDLRLAVWLTRASARMHGLAGAVQGLQLVHTLLEQQWDTVHPQLDAEDDNDPTMRLNALLPLFTGDGGMADLRAATLAPVRGSLTLRELELGLGRDQPHGDEIQPTETGVLQALESLLTAHPGVADDITNALQAVKGTAALLDDKVGSRAPDAAPLQRLLTAAAQALAQVQGAGGDGDATDSGDGAADDDTGARNSGGGGRGGELRTRADAQRELERVCQWLEKNEPSNPAPLLIRRAQRLMNMSFIDIIRDMASNGLDQVEQVVGKPPEDS